MNPTKFENISFVQPANPLLSPDEVAKIESALAYTVGGRTVRCIIGNAPFNGHSVMKDDVLTIRAYAPFGEWPQTVARYIGNMSFSSLFSALSFLVLHELAHLFLPGQTLEIEQACDIMAISLQSDFELAPPRLAIRK